MLKRVSMVFKSVCLLAVISVALCLIPAGWSFFGVAIVAAIVFTLTHTLMVRAERPAFLLSLTALLLLGATQLIFWTFTYPMNVATNNWTITPQDFDAVRRQWEYSHAINAVITFVAFVTITLYALTYKHEIERMQRG